jgi:hypothetical protein
MQSNFIYIVIAVIIILYTTNEINDRYNLYSLVKPRSKSILVDIDGNVVSMDSNAVKQHLVIIKNILQDMSKIPYLRDNVNDEMFDAFVIGSLGDLEKFKHDNHYYNNIEKNAHSAANINEIINNIGQVIYVLDNNICKTTISFGNIHSLIKLYSKLTREKAYKSYDDRFDSGVNYVTSGQKYFIDDVNTYCNSYTFDQESKIKDRIAPIKPRNNNMELSQNPDAGFGTLQHDGELYINDTNNKSFEKIHQTVKINTISNDTYESQYRTDSGLTFVIKRDNIPSYIPFCDLSKMREEVSNANKYIIDFDSKHSLRNDYNL